LLDPCHEPEVVVVTVDEIVAVVGEVHSAGEVLEIYRQTRVDWMASAMNDASAREDRVNEA
jgi:hypothetical protein